MRSKDPLILGGGPAGAAAAIMLARAGHPPMVLEAQRETGDALCGGFLSWRTLQTLESLGVSGDELGGHPVSRLRLFSGKRSAEARLPAGAVGVSRRRLDSLLLDRAMQAGAAVERGVSAKALEPGGALRLGDGAALRPETLFLATGKHDLRGVGRPRSEAPTLGLRVRLGPHPALTKLVGDGIELHLFDGGYAGLVLQEDGSANLCLALRKAVLAGAGGDPAALLAQLATTHPHLGERLTFGGERGPIEAIAAVPYGWIARDTRPGQFRLGDQAACIPSLAGEGNGLALASGILAAGAWGSGGAGAAGAYQTAFARAASRPISVAKLVWHAGESPRLAPALIATARFAPQLARMIAALTRIRH